MRLLERAHGEKKCEKKIQQSKNSKRGSEGEILIVCTQPQVRFKPRVHFFILVRIGIHNISRSNTEKNILFKYSPCCFPIFCPLCNRIAARVSSFNKGVVLNKHLQ